MAGVVRDGILVDADPLRLVCFVFALRPQARSELANEGPLPDNNPVRGFFPSRAQVVVQEVEVEVESQKMAEHRQALENYSRAVEEQRNRLGQVTKLRQSSWHTRCFDSSFFQPVPNRKGNTPQNRCWCVVVDQSRFMLSR